MGSGSEVIPFFAVLCDVEAFDFLFRRYTQTDEEVNDFEQDERAHDGKNPGNGYSHKLIEELMPVALDDTGRQSGAGLRILEDRIDGAGGEDAGEKCSVEV